MEEGAARTTTNEERAKKAKRLFFIGLADLSWRLAAVIIIPIAGGSWLDDRLNKGDLFTLIGLGLATIFSAYIIYRTSQKLTKDVENV